MPNKKQAVSPVLDREQMLAKRKQILKEAFQKAKVAKISGYPNNAVKRSEPQGVTDWHSREGYYREAREMGLYSDHDSRGGGDYRRTMREYGF